MNLGTGYLRNMLHVQYVEDTFFEMFRHSFGIILTMNLHIAFILHVSIVLCTSVVIICYLLKSLLS